jgi:hypothetical protein
LKTGVKTGTVTRDLERDRGAARVEHRALGDGDRLARRQPWCMPKVIRPYWPAMHVNISLT